MQCKRMYLNLISVGIANPWEGEKNYEAEHKQYYVSEWGGL